MNVSVIIYSQLAVVLYMLIVFLMLVTSKLNNYDCIRYKDMYFFRYEMSTADAIDLGRRAIVHAAHRDAASGNIVRSNDNFLI